MNPNPISFFVPGTPQPAGSKRAFVLRGGAHAGRAIITDANRKAKPWQQEVKGIACEHTATDALGCEYLLIGPLSVTMEFRLHRPQGHYGSGKNQYIVKAPAPKYPDKKPDALKLARAVEDALTSVIWRDDAQIVQEHLSKVYVEGNIQTGVQITIEEI